MDKINQPAESLLIPSYSVGKLSVHPAWCGAPAKVNQYGAIIVRGDDDIPRLAVSPHTRGAQAMKEVQRTPYVTYPPRLLHCGSLRKRTKVAPVHKRQKHAV